MASIFIRDTLHGLQTRFAFRRIIDTMDACNDFGSNERIVSIVIESKMGKTWPGSGYNFNPRRSTAAQPLFLLFPIPVQLF